MLGMEIQRIPLKPIVWVRCEIKTPPFSERARIKAGELLAIIQVGAPTKMPHFRPMPSIGTRCLEIRVSDGNCIWRIVCFMNDNEIAVLDVFQKKTNATPKSIIERCKKRLLTYKRT
jgi:phage-related protein